MTEKKNDIPQNFSRGEFINTALIYGLLGIGALTTYKGVTMLFPKPPRGVDLPPPLEETPFPTLEPTQDIEPTHETHEIDEGLTEEPTQEPTPEPTPEPSSTPEIARFDPETDIFLENIDLTRPFVMDVPHKTGQTGGWGSLRYNIVPSFAFGNSWSDPMNAEAVFNYENFSYGTDDAIVVPTKKGGFALMLHSASWGGVLLSGDVWRQAVDNQLDPDSDRKVVGKSLSFYQDYRENQLLLTATSALKVSAGVFNTSFEEGSENYPMVCDVGKMGVLDDGPGKIHFIACSGEYVDDQYTHRYVLSWKSLDVTAFSMWMPKTA